MPPQQILNSGRTTVGMSLEHPVQDCQGYPFLCGNPLTACTQGNDKNRSTFADSKRVWFSNNVSAPGFALGTVIGFLCMVVALSMWEVMRKLV